MKKCVKNAAEARELTRYRNGTEKDLEEFLEMALKEITEAAQLGDSEADLVFYICPDKYINANDDGFEYWIQEGVEELQSLGFEVKIIKNQSLEIKW